MSPAIGVVTILERVTVVFPAAVTALITVIKSIRKPNVKVKTKKK